MRAVDIVAMNESAADRQVCIDRACAGAATGLAYMQQRYYDPQIVRLLSVDPVMAYDNPSGAFNRY